MEGNWRRPAAVILALGVIVMAFILAWVGSWLTIWWDEWNFIFWRQTLSLDTFLVPHVDAFVALPAAVYYVVLHAFGLTMYYPLLMADWLAHFACVGLLGYIVARKSGVLIGLMAALSLLFLGSAFEVLLQPFQMQYLFSAMGGLLALLALDREARTAPHYAVATIALLGAIASSGVGPIMAGMVLVWAVLRRDRPALYIATIALIAYGTWYVGWQAHLSRVAGWAENLPNVPIEILYGLGAAVSGVIGLPPARFAWLGLAVGVALVLIALWRGLRPTPMAIAAVLALAAEYTFQAVFRGAFGLDHGARSAYLYPAAIFIWLAVAGIIGRRLDPRRWTGGRRLAVPALIGMLVVPMALGNMTQFVLAANAMRPLRLTELRELALMVKLRDVPGLALDAPSDPDLLPQVTARQYFAAIDRFGTPQIPNHGPADYGGHNASDNTALNALVLRLLGGAITVGPDGAPAAAAPTLEVVSGTTAPDGRYGCTALTPASGAAQATWSPSSAGVAIYAEQATDVDAPPVQLFIGFFAPADAPVDATILAAVQGGETIWLPALPESLHWTLTLKVDGNAVVHVCSKQ
ncbi:MAG: hypothetical protein QOJ81_665 [Chloroflexota bacterium]|jgi:hypothetical protein|nr:hypothetical protein [Chloroflexota bacterium]